MSKTENNSYKNEIEILSNRIEKLENIFQWFFNVFSLMHGVNLSLGTRFNKQETLSAVCLIASLVKELVGGGIWTGEL